ncbi:MAG: transcriptional regulator [Proteobacteria bacterium]|nr:transcriptional regulator [Pseudomonadota bacterium]
MTKKHNSSFAGDLPAPSAARIPDALAQLPHLPDDALARLPVVQSLYACSPATVWRRVKAGLIPAPIKIGSTTAWRVGDLRAALAQLHA